MKKSHSSKQWLRRHVNDPYVQRSKKEGYRSRSAYKLTEIDERDKVLKRGHAGGGPGRGAGRVVPGRGQARGRAGRVVAIDLLEMEPVSGVTFVQADFASKGLDAVEGHSAGRKADVVLSDMAPNLSGDLRPGALHGARGNREGFRAVTPETPRAFSW